MEVLAPDVHTALFAVTAMDHAHGLATFQPSSPSQPNSPEFYAFQKLLQNLYRSPSISLQRVERLRGHLHRIYTLRTADKAVFVLKCPPTRDARLLRHEHKSLETEAHVIEVIKANTRLPVPHQISYDLQQINIVSTPFLLRSYIPGTSLADMLPYLSTTDRTSIERTLGSYYYSLSQIRHTRFGLIPRVHAGNGHTTWSETFVSLLEAVLRDAEDMLISLPYEIIRYHVSSRIPFLDQITEPRLVALEAGYARNVLVDDQTRQIAGLLGLSSAVWGDPMMSGVFSEASDAFWEGYGGKPQNDHNAHARGLIYQMYRSVVEVVTQYYRPQHSAQEFEARRRLTWSLNQLSAI